MDSSPMTEPADLVPVASSVGSGLLRLGRGGMNAIAAVYDECHEDLFGYVVSLTRDQSIAEDFLQEAFAQLARATSTGHPPENPRAWLYTVCTNLAFSRTRRRAIVERWQHLVGGVTDADTDEAAEDVVLRRERNSELGKALQSLPTAGRAALLLAADGFSGREVATVLRKSEGATRNLMWRSRLALQVLLAAGGTR